MRYRGLPTSRAPDTPVPVAPGYSRRLFLQPAGGVTEVMPDNNIVEQDHRAIKRAVRPMLGFKSFWSAAITLAGIGLMHMIRKGQLKAAGKLRPAQQFYSLAGWFNPDRRALLVSSENLRQSPSFWTLPLRLCCTADLVQPIRQR